MNISMMQVYAPTLTLNDYEVDDFYLELGCLKQAIPASNMVVIMGDLNAKVGAAHYLRSEVVSA